MQRNLKLTWVAVPAPPGDGRGKILEMRWSVEGNRGPLDRDRASEPAAIAGRRKRRVLELVQ